MTTTDNHVTREQFRALEVYVVNQLPTREHLAELRTEVLGRFGQLDERLERVEGRLDQHAGTLQEVLNRLPPSNAE